MNIIGVTVAYNSASQQGFESAKHFNNRVAGYLAPLVGDPAAAQAAADAALATAQANITELPSPPAGSDTTATFGNSAAHAAKFAKLAVAFMVEAAIDSTSAGTLQFSAASYSVNENGGTASLTVSRADGSFGAATVHCRTVAGGTATAGADYTAIDATLSWAAGQGGNRTCSVPILAALVMTARTM